MTSGKELFLAAMSGATGSRPAFLLHANADCASFAGVGQDEFRKDAESIRATLAELQQVCGADAITAVYDPAAEDEAFASVVPAPGETSQLPNSGPDVDLPEIEDFDLASHPAMAASFDATNRLIRTLGQRSAAICGSITGPISAAARLLGADRLGTMLAEGLGSEVFESFSAPLTTVLRRLCELGVDAVVLREDSSVDSAHQDFARDCAFAYRMMNSVARHYNVPLIFAFDVKSDLQPPVRSLEVDVVSLPLDRECSVDGLRFAVHDRIPNAWLAPGDGETDAHERILANVDARGRVIEAEWFGEGRASLERVMRLGRICGSLRERAA